MLITNPKRRKPIKFFVDEMDHTTVQDKYFGLFDRKQSLPKNRLLTELRKLMAQDVDFYDSYNVVVDLLFSNGHTIEATALLKYAYERAILRICDIKGRWPLEMEWGFLENRHLMRIIERYGFLCWENGDTKQALEIFRRLLHCNPNDNQGVRYYILAIKMGIGIDDWEKPFESKEHAGYLNASELNNWFYENAKNFPDEFEWWVKSHPAR